MSELKDYDIMDIEAFDDERIKASSNGMSVPATRVYIKAEVDSAIDELKREHHRERHEYIDMVAQLKAENDRLKKKMDDYHLMSDIRRAKINELKRALWMARKAHAVAMVAYWDSHYRDNPNAVYRNRTIDWLRNRWLLILDAIIKKEKEYK